MSILSNRQVLRRLSDYPDQIFKLNESYNRTTSGIRNFRVNPEGQVSREAARLDERLRIYDFALSSCVDRANKIVSDIDMDIAALKNALTVAGKSKDAAELIFCRIDDETDYNLVRTTIATLETELATAQTIISRCEDSRAFAKQARQVLALSVKEHDLTKLLRLERELRNFQIKP